MKSFTKPTFSMEGHPMSQHVNVDMNMDMNSHRSNMRDMYRDNQDMASNMMNYNRMGQNMTPTMMKNKMMRQEMSSNIKDTQNHPAFSPNQYFAKDDFGNYAYSYNDQKSEKSEKGNAQSIKGQYAYVMSNGVKRRVEYIADNDGFHIIRDNADPARIKRSSEPDLLQTRMMSRMDSSSFRDDTQRINNIMGHNVPSNLDKNLEHQRYSNMIGKNMMIQKSLNHNMMGQGTMSHNMMDRDNVQGIIMGQDHMGHNMIGQDSMRPIITGRDIYNIMSNRGMTSDVNNMMSQNINSKMMGQDMTRNVMSQNMMGQEGNSQQMNPNMLAHQNMIPKVMYSNMMDMSNNQLSSHGMSSDLRKAHSNNGIMGQRMMQKMEIASVPEIYISSRLF